MENEPLYREIGTRIRARRLQLVKTQEELAKVVGLSRPSLANIEGGRQTLLVHQLCLIAEALNLPTHDLLPEYRVIKGDIAEEPIMPAGLSESQQLQLKAFLSPVSRSLVVARERKG
jgi:transcriptional regulator with XRE-family HTH domain